MKARSRTDEKRILLKLTFFAANLSKFSPKAVCICFKCEVLCFTSILCLQYKRD
jgi:hypothetical protein